MTAMLIDGKSLATTMQTQIAAEVATLERTKGVRPGLAAVLIGDNPASQIYVRNKRKACAQVGMESWLHPLPADVPQQELLQLIAALNIDPLVHGILKRLPRSHHRLACHSVPVLSAAPWARKADAIPARSARTE